MFTKYEIKDGNVNLEFFAHSKKTRNGFMHEAAMFGFPKRADGQPAFDHSEELWKKRYAKITYCNRTWEVWPGQSVLKKLWEGLAEMKDEYPIFAGENPFASNEEPKAQYLPDPEEVFYKFKER